MGLLDKLFSSTESHSTGVKSVSFFREILNSKFPDYQIKENVAVTDLVGEANDSFQLYARRPYQAYKAEWGQPFTFALYKDGVVKAVVMLGDKRSHHEKVKFLISRMYAKKFNIPYISFYLHMPNERDYVIQRISDFLSGKKSAKELVTPLPKVEITMQEIAEKFNLKEEQIVIVFRK